MKTKNLSIHVLTAMLLLYSALTTLLAQQSPKIPLTERQALIDLFNATNGNNWYNKSGWLGKWGTEKNWYGVMIFETKTTANITGILMEGNNLSGYIPSSLKGLPYLMKLDIGTNKLSGYIPSELGYLGNLDFLCIESNQLSGSIPITLGYLSKLVELHLCNNQLSGSIPEEFGYLWHLQNLTLNDNLLSGSIPSSLGYLGKLQNLSMAKNQLSGSIPEELGNLRNLQNLTLNDNLLTGSIPTSIGNLLNLKNLSMRNNQLSGSIPKEIGKLKNLESLDLACNKYLSGSIPVEIGNLSKLKFIEFRDNQLSGDIPKEIGNLSNLEWVCMDTNKLTRLPNEFGRLSKLRGICLPVNNLRGSIPPELGNLRNLEWVCLSQNELSGSIPEQLGNIASLKELYLSVNKLTGEIPSNLTNLSNLTRLEISTNCLYVTDPKVKSWVDRFCPGWENSQDQCPCGQLKVVDQQSGKEWKMNNIILPSEVEIDGNGINIKMRVKEDGTFMIKETLPPGYYNVICRLNYYDYIPYSNNSFWGGVPAPAEGKLIRQSVRKMAKVKIDEDNPIFDIKFPLPIFLVHGIRSGWTIWDPWVSDLLNQGYIVFTPNHDFRGINKSAEATQLAGQFFVDLDYTYSPNHIGLFKYTYPNVFFICHSEGGVVTRALVNHYPSIRNRIKCIFTLGTPHSGTDFPLASLYELNKIHMVGTFNKNYPNFRGVPVYAISGHGWELMGEYHKPIPHDGIVYWNNDSYSNISPFEICTGLDINQNPKVLTEIFSGYSDFYIANGHHFLFPHAMLIDAGSSRRDILKATIIPIMGGVGTSVKERETHQVNFNYREINSKPFLRKILEQTFFLSRQSTKRFQINVSSTDVLSVNAMGLQSNIAMKLIDPGGITISKDNYSTYPSASYSDDIVSGIEYRIATPKPGKWTIDVTAGDVNDIIAIGASENSNWVVSGYSDKISYQPNTKVVFNAKLYGSTDGVTVSSINADIVNENGSSISSLALFDDGTHDDNSIGDGIYGNSMTIPNATGKYFVTFHVEALSGGYPAQSESNWHFYVLNSEEILKGTFSDESSDADSDGIKDQIIEKVGLKFNSAGQYLLSGNLVDNSGYPVDNSVTTIEASSAGDYEGTLTFDLKGLHCSQFNGPFKIKNIRVSNADYLVPMDEWSVPVSTNTYDGADFGCNSTALSKIKLNREKLNFGVIRGSTSPSQSVTIENSGSGLLNWVISSASSWVGYDTERGTNNGTVSVSADSTNLSAGTYDGILWVTDPYATNSPQSIDITLKVYDTGKTSIPFGEFATPTDGSTVSGSIPVTGWALDDIGIESVKLYRGEVGNLTYIGDVIFVEGARPDVEQAYPGYPINYKAGWGYMLLTNFLPSGGNGEYKIHAIATDSEGHQITLGTKTIICDNAHAVKPFGAIDTPTQGGNASGKNFVNWGWVLTPQSDKITEDGSTINIWVDGKKIGSPTYNIYREDIAGLFPGYANSNGAIGYFSLDTTRYENGIHTIYWTATDSGGDADGIGSRYFSISNTGQTSDQSRYEQNYQHHNGYIGDLSSSLEDIAINNIESLCIKKGFEETIQNIDADEHGIYHIAMHELDLVEIDISGGNPILSGYMRVGNQLRPLPIGSTLDTNAGKFYWNPGPGFVGNYHFVFIESNRDNCQARKEIMVDIRPKAGKPLDF